MKRIIASLFALSMITCTLPFQQDAAPVITPCVAQAAAYSASYSNTYGTWKYTYTNGIDTSEGYKITSFTIKSGVKSVTVPNVINSIPVTELGDNFLSNNKTVTAVSTGTNLKKIGKNFCMYATAVKTVTLGKNVEVLGDYAMYGCSAMTALNYSGNSLKSFGYGSLWANNWADNYKKNNSAKPALVIGNMLYRYFDKCTSINFANTVCGNKITYINDYAFSADNFAYATSLKTVNLSGIQTIGQNAFAKCSNLTAVGLDETYFTPDNVKSVFHSNTFKWFYKGDSAACSINNLEYSGTSKTCDIPSSLNGLTVTAIGDGMLDGSAFTTINIGDSVKFIGNGFAQNTAQLVSVKLPKQLETLGGYCFYNCPKMTTLTYTGTNVKKIGSGSFWCNKWNDDYFVKNPNAEAIVFGTYLYRYNKTTTSIDFSKPVCGTMINYIGYDAFSFDAYAGQSQIKSVNLGTTINAIYGRAFDGCSALTTITGGSNLCTIEADAFHKNTLAAIEKQYQGKDYVLLGNTLLKWKNTTSTTVDLAVINNGNLRGISRNAFDGCAVTSLYLPTHGDLVLANETIPAKVSHVYYGGKNNGPVEFTLSNINKNAQMKSIFFDSLNAFSGTAAMKNNVLKPFVTDIYDDYGIKYYGGVTSSLSQAEQVRIAGKMYSYLRDNVTYKAIANSGSGEQTLLLNQGQCGGYAFAYVILLELAGVDAEMVGGPGHAWSLAKIGSNWYHVDACWASDGYDFFLETSDAIAKRDGTHHTPYTVAVNDPYLLRYGFTSASKSGITCTSTMADYNKNGKLDQTDVDTLTAYLNGTKTLTAAQKVISDINGDGSINETDKDLLARRLDVYKSVGLA